MWSKSDPTKPRFESTPLRSFCTKNHQNLFINKIAPYISILPSQNLGITSLTGGAVHYQGINNENPPLKVRAAGFLSGISLFSDFGFWKLAPGFYWFSNFKNSFAGFHCFLRFGSNSVLFSSFFSVFALKTPKKFPPAAGGILLFLKKIRLRRDLIFLQNP